MIDLNGIETPPACEGQLPATRTAAKPQHWAQMQVYMHLTGPSRARYIAVRKDTDDLHLERIRADGDAAERLLAKAGRIIHSARPPARVSEDPTWFECRFCDHRSLCYDEAAAAVSCRSCLHSTAVEGGWRCARWVQSLDVNSRRQACDRHLFMPDLLPSEVVDAGDDHVVYRMRNDGDWVEDAREAVAC